MPSTHLVRRRIDNVLLGRVLQQRCYRDGGSPSTSRKPRLSRTKVERAKDGGPTLFEQLFPDQQTPPDPPKQQQQQSWEPPPPSPAPRQTSAPGWASAHRKALPEIETLPPTAREFLPNPPVNEADIRGPYLSPAALGLQRKMARESTLRGPELGVLILRNASKNLVEDDFRRLVPRGQHMEGWKLSQGDILKHIPGRDWRTLERENHHYLLFSSPVSAFAYQGHVMRVHRLVTQHTPRNHLSPMLPPPDYLVAGLDAAESIESFTLTPPNAALDLRQLKQPLTPFVELLVKHHGPPPLMIREDKSPFEARLTLEGPQIHGSSIRHLFMFSGKDRGLSWSGSDDPAPKITEWHPERRTATPSSQARGREADQWARSKGSFELRPLQNDIGAVDANVKDPEKDRKTRTEQKVFVIGFQTENAMQSFVRFWHKRPMEWKGLNKHYGVGDKGDLPAIAHVEPL